MKLIEHIYAIKNLTNRGVASDDSRFNNSLLAHLLKINRANLIEKKADKYHFISEQSFQSLCVPLTKGQYHNCCDNIDTECYFMKSTIKLPKILNTRWGDFIKVTTLTGEVISKTSITLNSLAKYSITNSKPKTGWFIIDGYLGILNNTFLETALVNTLFSDPTEIENLNCVNTNSDCSNLYEEEFPIDSDLIDPLYKMTIDYLMKAGLVASDDEDNQRAVEFSNERE